MPIYEYECKKCGELYEVLQKIDDPPLEICTKIHKKKECGGKLERLISAANFDIKGYSYKNGYSEPSAKRK